MKTNLIYIVLFFCLGVFSVEPIKKIYHSYEKHENPLSIENLSIAESEYKEKATQPNRAGQINQRKLQEIELQENTNLARMDVSEFFKKDIPLNEPNLPYPYLITWASLAVSDIMTFGFNDYKSRLSVASDYFTQDGWESFSSALQRSRIVEMVEQNQQIVSAAISAAPVLQSAREMDGVYQWIMQIPMVLTYRSGSKSSTTGVLVTVVIMRSSDKKHPYGIAINQWIATSR
ncbi:MAG: DotI/IcmL/TraM family protein [Alphaproteobacteria bacterium]